jgi:hypothetical protein
VNTRLTNVENLKSGTNLTSTLIALRDLSGNSSLTATVNSLSSYSSALQSISMIGNGQPILLWQDFTTPLLLEANYSNAAFVSKSIVGMPATARFVLADIFISSAANDAIAWW